MSDPLSAQGMSTGAKIKLALVILVAVLLGIFVLSNGQAVRVFFFSGELMSVPAWLLILLSGGAGGAIGWTVHASRVRRKKKKEAAEKA